MSDFLKPTKKLLELLEEPSYEAVGAPALALGRTLTQAYSFGTGASAVELERTEELATAAGDFSVISRTAWIPTNVPTIASVENGEGEAEISLSGATTLTIKSTGDAQHYGGDSSHLSVTVAAPSSTTAGGCIHPAREVVYSAEVTNLAGANTITATISLPAGEGYRVPTKGIARVFVTNTEQGAISNAYEVEIV